MSRERWGVVAFLVLAAFAVSLPIAVREEERMRGVSCAPANVPIYPGARAIGLPTDVGRLLEAVNDLGLTTTLEGVAAYLVPAEGWLGPRAVGGDVFAFYLGSMSPVSFDEMGPELRRLLGLPETGPVDSPPLLLTGEGTALMIRPTRDGSLTLLVMRCHRATSEGETP